jgi:serine protease Do
MQARLKPLTIFALYLVILAALFSSAEAAELPDFTTLVKSTRNTVVNISTTMLIKSPHGHMNQMPFPNLPENSPFNEFFKHFFQGPNGQIEHQVRSLGSGFIISSDGEILTNAHVVKNAEQIIVRLRDHEEKPAKLIGLDERTDVALLKIDAHDLPTIKVGDSDKLQVGDWVLAIGSPFGLDYTATQGIVSALGRSLPSDTYVPFIQTDVAVNPGNSGGPLFDTAGEVVGINSQIYSSSGGYMGLSFAIPINVAMKVAEQIKTSGHASHGWLGVLIQPVTQNLAESFGLDSPRGALVANVEPGSPAAKAGVKTGDIILNYDGKKLDTSAALPPLVGATNVGKEVKLKVLRKGRERTLDVTIEKLPETMASAKPVGQTKTLNLVVSDLNPQQRKELGIGDRGVLVQEVGPGPAANAGIRPGDVLLQLNEKDIHDVSQLEKLVNKLPKGKAVTLFIQRNKSPMFLALTIPK